MAELGEVTVVVAEVVVVAAAELVAEEVRAVVAEVMAEEVRAVAAAMAVVGMGVAMGTAMAIRTKATKAVDQSGWVMGMIRGGMPLGMPPSLCSG
jgi:uncharacterized membrane protein